MASTNIIRLPESDEIKSGDFVIVETADGTRILDFKNFLISTDNITFASTLSTYETDIKNNRTDIDSLTGALLNGKQDIFVASISSTKGLSANGGSGELRFTDLPTSNTGLKPGDVFTQSISAPGMSAFTKVLCVV